MPDLRLEIEGNNFTLEPLSEKGELWLMKETGEHDGMKHQSSILYPLFLQDMITHEVQDQGLVISS